MRNIFENPIKVINRTYKGHRVVEVLHEGSDQLPDETIERYIKDNPNFDTILITNYGDNSFNIELTDAFVTRDDLRDVI